MEDINPQFPVVFEEFLVNVQANQILLKIPEKIVSKNYDDFQTLVRWLSELDNFNEARLKA